MTIIGTRNERTEILLNNYLDNEFKKMLLPLNIMHNFIFFPKFKIMNNFITPNNTYQNMIAVFGFAIYLIPFTIKYFMSVRTSSDYIYNFFDLMFYAYGIGTNCLISALQTNSNVNLVLSLSKTHHQQIFKINLRRITTWNWIYIVSCITLYFSNALYITIEARNLDNLVACVCIYILICIDINMVYAIRILQVIRMQLENWILEFESPEVAKSIDINENIWNKRFQMYVDIQETFTIYKKVHQIQVISFMSVSSLIFENRL
ncbi:uncharacterized protein LOC135309948 [Plodia interpunctella]|uniref:uncharacterized protein LOC135309948 n=1 Tax=Plodia interpunctella TaxID=58824 RepID=UPI00310166B6